MSGKGISMLIAGVLAVGMAGIADARKPDERGPWVQNAATQRAAQLQAQPVRRYVTDAFGDVDGLLLEDGSLVRFPAHQSSQIVGAIKPGDAVSVSGITSGDRVIEAWTLANAAGAIIAIRTPKSSAPARLPKHLRSAALKPLEASGRISHVAYGKKGEIKLALLEDGTALRLGKHAGRMAAAYIALGRDVTVRGIGTENPFGRAIEVTELGIGNGPMTPLYAISR